MDSAAQKPYRGRKQGKSHDRRGGYQDDNNDRNGHNVRGGGGGQGRGSMGSKNANHRGRGGPRRGAGHGPQNRRPRGGGGAGQGSSPSNFHDYNAYRDEQATTIDKTGIIESRGYEVDENTSTAKRNTRTNGGLRPPKNLNLKNEPMGAQNQFSTNESVNQNYPIYNDFAEQPPGTEPQQPTMTTSHQPFGSMNQNIGSMNQNIGPMNQTNETWSSQMNRGGTWYNQVPQTVEQVPVQSQQAQINAMMLWSAYQQSLASQELLMQRLAADNRIANDSNFIKQIEDTAALVRTLGQQWESFRQSQIQPQLPTQTQNQSVFVMNQMGTYTGYPSFATNDMGVRTEEAPANVDDSAVAETSGLNPEASEFQPFGQESYMDSQTGGFVPYREEAVEEGGQVHAVADDNVYRVAPSQLEGQPSEAPDFEMPKTIRPHGDNFVQVQDTKTGFEQQQEEQEQEQEQEREPEPEPEEQEQQRGEHEAEAETSGRIGSEQQTEEEHEEEEQQQQQEEAVQEEVEEEELERDELTGLALSREYDPLVYSMEKIWEYQRLCEEHPNLNVSGLESRSAFESVKADNPRYLSQFRDIIIGGEGGGLRPRSTNIRPVRPPAAASTIAGGTTPAGTKDESRYHLQMDHRLSSNAILKKRVTGILNRITLENFASLSQKLFEVVQTKMEDMEKYELVLSCILNKAASDIKFLDQYVNLCEKLYEDEWKVLTRLVAEQASKSVSPTVVQKKFCDMALKILHDEYLSQKERVLEKIEDKKEFENYSKDDLDEIKMIRKNKLLGIMSVIGEFYNRKLMEENEIISLLTEILHKKGVHIVPLDIEAVCALLQQCGKTLQRQANTRRALEQSLTKMTNLSKSMETRIRFRVDEINAILNKKEPASMSAKDGRGGGRSKAGGSQDLRYQAKKPQETPTTSPAKEKGSQLSWTATAKTSTTQPPVQDMSKKLLNSFKETMNAMEQTYVLEDAIDFVKENIDALTSRNWANIISYVCLKWKKELVESLFLRWVAEILKQSLLPSQKLIEMVGELSRSFDGDRLDYPLLGQLYEGLFALLSKHDPTVNYAAKFEEMRKQK